MDNTENSILTGAKEALDYARSKKKHGYITHEIKIPEKIDVKSIRENLHMSRIKFANYFGFNVRTLEKWEREERIPEGPTRAYLMVIANNPNAVRRALENYQD